MSPCTFLGSGIVISGEVLTQPSTAPADAVYTNVAATGGSGSGLLIKSYSFRWPYYFNRS